MNKYIKCIGIKFHLSIDDITVSITTVLKFICTEVSWMPMILLEQPQTTGRGEVKGFAAREERRLEHTSPLVLEDTRLILYLYKLGLDVTIVGMLYAAYYMLQHCRWLVIEGEY